MKTPINEAYYLNNQLVQMTKGYTSEITSANSVQATDMFAYISYYYEVHHNAMKYKDDTKTSEKYGDASQYDCMFYLNQAKTFFDAAKTSPSDVAMLPSYYCMLNLAKSYLSFKSEYVEDFVEDFQNHGIKECRNCTGKDLGTIKVNYNKPKFDQRNNIYINNFGGVFPMLAKSLDADFETVWDIHSGKSLKALLYNLPFVKSAYVNTYGSSKNKIDELFIPLADGTAPYYCKQTKTTLKLRAEIDEAYLKAGGGKLGEDVINTISKDFGLSEDGFFESIDVAKRNSNDSISSELKGMNTALRRNFAYVGGSRPKWYMKRTGINNTEILNLSTITINMAIMHRLSEIVRYKPEQLHRLMNDKEKWLINEYMHSALDQFVDEMASEITGNDVVGNRWN